MAQFKSIIRVTFSILLLTASFLEAKLEAKPKNQASAAPVKYLDLQNLTEQQFRQFEFSETVLDTMGQSIASGASTLPANRKKSAQNHLKTLRYDIDTIKRVGSTHTNHVQLYHLAFINAAIITCLEEAVRTDLASIPNLNEVASKGKMLSEENISLETINKLLKHNERRLIKLVQDSEKIGLSSINAAYRKVRKFNKDYMVTSVAEHVAVYSAMYALFIYNTGKDTIDTTWLSSLPLSQWVKAKVGGPSKQFQDKRKAPVGYLEVKKDTNGDPIKNTDGKILLKGAKILSIVETDSKGNQKFTPYDPSKYAIDKDETPLYGTKEIESAGSVSGGQVDSATSTVKNILKLTLDGPIFTYAAAGAFALYIKNDYEEAVKIYDRYKHMIDDKLFGITKKNRYDEITIRSERFSDIVGREDVKAEFGRVIEYICNPDKFDRAGIKVERGYLLAGEPQTGKTLMAKALAGEIASALEKVGKKQKVRLFEISTESLAKKGIAYYMELAKTQAPCILFLDELDLLRLQRDGDTKMLSEFLTSMSGSLNSNEKDHVIILAATNKPENVDFALRQHGRFGKMFWFDKPTFKHRVEFFIKESEKRCMHTSAFNFNVLAQQTEGCSFGTLDIVMKKALMHAKLENAPVSQAHFEKSINFEVKKLIPHGYTVPAEKELIVAARQAGKALTSIMLQPAKSLCSVTVLPITQEFEEEHVTQQYNFANIAHKQQRAVRYGGIFAYHLYDALDIMTQDELAKQCKILLAGNVAQKVYGLASCAYDKTDKQEAFKLAKQIVFEGIDISSNDMDMGKDIREAKLTEAYRLLEAYEKEVEELLAQNKQHLTDIVAALQKRKTLSVGEINELLKVKATPAIAA